jgi:hypothetical protein
MVSQASIEQAGHGILDIGSWVPQQGLRSHDSVCHLGKLTALEDIG